MFAVIKTGGKQYKVAPGDLVTVEKLGKAAGEAVDFAEVLMVGEGSAIEVGKPFVAGAKVSAEIAEETRGPKLVVFKKRRRQNSRRKNGHRQDLTVLRITEIAGLGKVARAENAAAATEAQPKKRTRKKAAAAEAPAETETKE